MNDHPAKRKESISAKILRSAVVIGGWLPLFLLAWNAISSNLGFNPIETVLRYTGRVAVIFLLLSLTCTPLHRIFKLPAVRRLRKPLGLFAALYAMIHFITFALWDYQLDLSLIWLEISQKPFILIGTAALIILVLLTATSFKSVQRKMGKGWIKLHRLVYAAGVLVSVHYLFAIKGDLFSLQGAYGPPIIAGSVLILLLALRLPFIYRPLHRLIGRQD